MTVAAVALVASWVTPLRAEEKTITGEAKCAKCALKETEQCQSVIQTKEGDKTVTYYLANNDVAKGFHEKCCKAPVKATATGQVKEKEGKMWLKATKIDVAQ